MLKSELAKKLNVFVSYSRDDLHFADQLYSALNLVGFSPTLDRHGISGGEDWKKRLGGLLRDADTIAFVLTPSSARSEICSWEVIEAARLGKRIIPIVSRPLESATPPPQLASLNYIYFYDEPKFPNSGFGAGLTQLVATLNTDFDWLREHTRLLQRAIEWDVGRRSDNRLLSGADVEAAKKWAAESPTNAPLPTELHIEFIGASEAAEAARKLAEDSRQEQLEELARYAAVEIKSRYIRTIKSKRLSSGMSFGDPEKLLTKAIDAYDLLSKSPRTRSWARINLLSLIRRAERDGVTVRASLRAEDIAASIVDDLKEPSSDRPWEYALIGEAFLGLGDIIKADYWFSLYGKSAGVDPASLEGTRRQLVELWEIDEAHPAAKLLFHLQKRGDAT